MDLVLSASRMLSWTDMETECNHGDQVNALEPGLALVLKRTKVLVLPTHHLPIRGAGHSCVLRCGMLARGSIIEKRSSI